MQQMPGRDAYLDGLLERALNDAAVDAERRARCCRGERARDEGNKGSYLLRCGEAFDERGGANFLEIAINAIPFSATV